MSGKRRRNAEQGHSVTAHVPMTSMAPSPGSGPEIARLVQPDFSAPNSAPSGRAARNQHKVTFPVRLSRFLRPSSPRLPVCCTTAHSEHQQ